MWRRAAAGAGGLAIALVAGLGLASLVAAPSSGPSTGGGGGLTPAELPGLAKVDVDSKRLAVALAPNELVTAHFQTGNDVRAGRVVRRAREVGLDPVIEDDERPSVRVVGPRLGLLTIAAMNEVNGVWLEEDLRALRPVAAAIGRPIALTPPGQPYLALGIPAPGSRSLEDLGPHRDRMLASLGSVVVTFDGRPYETVDLEGSCGKTDCILKLRGQVAGGSDGDYWSVTGSAATAWIGEVRPDDLPVLAGLPRWLVREAERIARADAKASAAIRKFDTMGSTFWNPDRSGVVELRYLSACGCCGTRGIVLAAFPVADQAACVPELRVAVDVVGARVLEVR